MNPWMVHLEKIRKKNPKLSLKEAMILARKSYKPKKKGKGIYQDTINTINKVTGCKDCKPLKDGEYLLPWSNYTGPGNEISDDRKAINATDACSRIHDIEYSKAKTPQERWASDEKVKKCFANAIKEDPVLGRLGYYGIAGKNMVEKSFPSVYKAIDPKRYAIPPNGGGLARKKLIKSLSV